MNSLIQPINHGRIVRDLADQARQSSSLRHFADPRRIRHADTRIAVAGHWMRPAAAVAYLDHLNRAELTLDQPC